MREMMLRLFLVLLMLVGSGMGFQREASYSILGSVRAANGGVVTNASVAAFPAGDQGSAGDFGWTHTDDKGNFRLVLRPGKCVVRAKDEADGYSDPSFLLCSNPEATFPQVLVKDSDVQDVVVVMGTKGGTIIGSLFHEATQQVIPKGRVVIRDARQHSVFVEIFTDEMGRFQFTAPNKAVQIIATAPGYETTNYDGGRNLLLAGGNVGP